jgi:serine/threonine-protein kinase RsbW
MSDLETKSSGDLFSVSVTPGTLRVSFSATLENIDRAVEETKRFVGACGMERQMFELILILREGLTNAVVHGCSCHHEMTIRYRLSLHSDFLEIEIEDEGEGFDWRDGCLLQTPGIECYCGRGMAIMKSYSGEMRFNEKGNILTLLKMFNDR